MKFTPDNPLRIGTRGSPLALAQARETAEQLRAVHNMPEEACRITVVKTTGDKRLEATLGAIGGGKGLFTKEIEEALLAGAVDLAVHSMKDVPTLSQPGLMLAAYLPRVDVRDGLIGPYASLAALPEGARIGTASLRRQAQLLNRRPGLKVVLFRGNVQTRLGKLEEGEADATFLAMAGLRRLGMTHIASPLSTDEMLPAIGQGAIGIECREADAHVRSLLEPLNHQATDICLQAERAFLAALDGSCRTPLAGLAELKDDRLLFQGEILRPDGSNKLEIRRVGGAADAAAMGHEAGQLLGKRGGPDYMLPRGV